MDAESMHSHSHRVSLNNLGGCNRCLPDIGEQFVRAASGLIIVGDRHQHDLVSLKLFGQAQQFYFYLFGGADGAFSSVFLERS